MSSIIVRPRAQADIDGALAWYAQRGADLSQRLLDELDVVFERISENPGQFPVVTDPVQRALVRKFPYSVYFVVSGEFAAIIAVIHQSRLPIDWKPRRR